MAVFYETPRSLLVEFSWREHIPGIDDDAHLKKEIQKFGITVSESPTLYVIYKQVKWGIGKSVISLERNGRVCHIPCVATSKTLLYYLDQLCSL